MYVVHKIPLPRLYNPIFGGGVLLFWSSYKQSFSPSLLDAGCILFLLVFCPKKKKNLGPIALLLMPTYRSYPYSYFLIFRHLPRFWDQIPFIFS